MHVKLFVFLFVTFFLNSCSNSTIQDEEELPINTDQKTYIKVNNIYHDMNYHHVFNIIKSGDVFYIYGEFGVPNSINYIRIAFTNEGKIFNFKYTISSYQGFMDYYCYRNYPSNFFNVDIVNLDLDSNKIKVRLRGFLYDQADNLNSFERIEVDMFFNETFTVSNPPQNFLTNIRHVNCTGQHCFNYCNAKINNRLWTARHDYSNGVFTSEDPYKIEIKFTPNTSTGIYDFNNSATVNCIKFYKFNVNTLNFDEFQVSGVLDLNYKEFHGGISNSFFGNFQLTATNPNNPNEVIQITDGKYRSFNPY